MAVCGGAGEKQKMFTKRRKRGKGNKIDHSKHIEWQKNVKFNVSVRSLEDRRSRYVRLFFPGTCVHCLGHWTLPFSTDWLRAEPKRQFCNRSSVMTLRGGLRQRGLSAGFVDWYTHCIWARDVPTLHWTTLPSPSRQEDYQGQGYSVSGSCLGRGWMYKWAGVFPLDNSTDIHSAVYYVTISLCLSLALLSLSLFAATLR